MERISQLLMPYLGDHRAYTQRLKQTVMRGVEASELGDAFHRTIRNPTELFVSFFACPALYAG